jgi:hypothetical protein
MTSQQRSRSAAVSSLISSHLSYTSLSSVPSSSLFFHDSDGEAPQSKRAKRKFRELNEQNQELKRKQEGIRALQKSENRRREIERAKRRNRKSSNQSPQKPEIIAEVNESELLDIWKDQKDKETNNKLIPQSARSAVEISHLSLFVPSSGSSYQPPESDRVCLVQRAADKEIQIAKRKRMLEERIQQAEENERMRESNIKSVVDSVVEADFVSVRPSTQPMSGVEKKKQRQAKQLSKTREEEKQRKDREKQMGRAQVIAAELKQLEKLQRRNKANKNHSSKPEIVINSGKIPFEMPKLQVLLEEEKKSSLREIIPASAGFEEQFKRFQARNLIEPRERIKTSQSKKKQRKFYDRYKDDPDMLKTEGNLV